MESNADIDKLTLELLVNKSKLQSYLAKTNPDEYERLKEKQALYQKHKSQIESFTHQLLEQHTRSQQPLLVNREIQSVFDEYIQLCIQHFERFGDDCEEERGEDDDDVLFGNMDKPKKSKKYTYIGNGTLDSFVKREPRNT
jgi:hypothetical protein